MKYIYYEGELIKIDGLVYVGGSVAYCSQNVWLQNISVRENILFGRKYDKLKYKKVIDICHLNVDIENFENGDDIIFIDP